MSVRMFSRLVAIALMSATALIDAVAQTTHRTASSSTTDQVIKFYQSKTAQDPDDIFNYDRLSSAYVQKARESGDITYYQLAETGLKKSLALESKHADAAPAFAELAAVYYAEHRFAEAAQEAQAAILISPAASAYATLGDARLEMGDYDQADSSYKHLQDSSAAATGPSRAPYLSATRQAGLDWIHGQTSSSIAELQHAIQVATPLHLPAENIAWTHFMLAEQFFQCGKLDRAEAEATLSLAAYPRYHRALAEMGRIRVAQGRFPDAIRYYTQAIGIIPLPIYAAALGDVYARVDDKSNAGKQYELVEYIGKISALNKQVFNRELAMFYADHDRELPKALELARKELEVRHDVYTHDALAWALYKNGRTSEAKDEMDKALQMGTQDALLMYHAGVIQRRSGDASKAREYLQKALQINPNFHIFYADDARNLLKQQAVVAKQPHRQKLNVDKTD